MRKFILPFFTVFSLVFVASCHEHSSGHGQEHENEAGEAAGHHHEAGESTDEIRLEPEMAGRFGVVCDTVRPGDFSESVRVTGRVLATGSGMATVVAPTSGILSYVSGIVPGREVGRGARIASVRTGVTTGGDANLAAKAALDAASRELERLKPLYEERLVTASEYNAAVAAYESAKAGYSSSGASGAATAPVAGVILSLDAAEGQYVDVGAPVATVVSDKELTLRIDLPRKMTSRMNSFTDARIALGDGRTVLLSDVGGKRAGASPAASGNVAAAYVPVFFSVPNKGGMFVPGSGFEAWLLGNRRDGVLSVPLTALSEQMGKYFVYERLDDECYRKLPVEPGVSDGLNVEILTGLLPGTVIVTAGVTTLRLSENAKVIPEGHSHHH